MRGKGKMAVQVNRENRITPAYAGKRAGYTPGTFYNWDHPRLCGEKQASQTFQTSSSGITPAYAGKRSSFSMLNRVEQDHPRLCGEKRVRSVHTFTALGSPPPMRGKGIPCPRSHSCGRDHPRLCGEKIMRRAWEIYRTGSPPPMRGKVRRNFPTECNIGITPAYAGKSADFTHVAFYHEDHPRLCGEKGISTQ